MTETLPHLNDAEARVLGVLIEKAQTTPEQYPLSLLAITNGCNQKSNRDPVVDFGEAEVVVALQGLVPKHLAGRVMAAGSRVEKFRHTARETLGLDERGLAILAELLMRGPQAPGELRARAHRMAGMPSQEDLRAALEPLVARGLVVEREPAPGSRARRFAQTLAPSLHPAGAGAHAPPAAQPAPAGERTPAAPHGSRADGDGALAPRVARLERELSELRILVEELRGARGSGDDA